MIKESIKQEIMARIKRAEQEYNVRVLYAVESGSRAWGFASENSDYDVRFIYAHPQDWYLTVDLEKKRDVIEYPIVDEIDINGWDVRKALQLMWKSNPAIVEWLKSPIVYRDDQIFAPMARNALEDLYSVEKGIYHYRNMAMNNYREHLNKETVTLKKYFYVLRALLSILWLEKYQSTAPIEFSALRSLISDRRALNQTIDELLVQKRSGQETEKAPPIPILTAFISEQLTRLEQLSKYADQSDQRVNRLNQIFQIIVSSYHTKAA
ncbi:nucleotidyltransferase domain-containing protein [Litoribacillus peritrichatus]|uniref:Nucleotidyltransferase domain-containing protein n=1 Tax=Litoribacillus peritrichatus TaxID=718191 RepID=A0ABP7NFL9_9GAMM